ncbi:MAG TPA: glycosyltransferase family protein [Nitrososphaerales archaeon]|nr:glycosyltransferase family protein [Nitrososphaerales archaeon]
MRKVLYGISPIGLGHATRSLVLWELLKKEGVDVKLFSGGKAAEFIVSLGVPVEDIVDDPVPTVVNGEMKRSALWYIRSWIALGRTIKRTERLFDIYQPDLVVCDEEFSGMALAEKRGAKRVFISDELMLGFGRTWLSRKIEARVDRWYRRLQESVDLLIVPEFGKDSGNTKYVGPIVRSPTLAPNETRNKYGLPEGKMVLFSMSGSGIGDYLLREMMQVIKRDTIPGAYLVVSGNRGPKVAYSRVYDLGLVDDNQNLISSADLVVSTAGKSTIDEAVSAGTPIITIPIKNHAEQERNAAALGYSYESLADLPDLMKQKIGKREPPRDFRGGEIISRLLISML